MLNQDRLHNKNMKTVKLICFVFIFIFLMVNSFSANLIEINHNENIKYSPLDTLTSCCCNSSLFINDSIIGAIFEDTMKCEDKIKQIHEVNKKTPVGLIVKSEKILAEYLKKNKYDEINLLNKGYLRQYFLIPYPNHDSIIYINSFHVGLLEDFKYWRNRIVHVLGGGEAFWSAHVNVTKDSVILFSINAPE